MPFPGKPTVVFLHGLSSNHTTWLDAMTAFHARGLNCIALDLRGHGYSDKTRRRSLYRFDQFSRDIAEILAQEQITQYLIIGYSFGGSVALDYAARYGDEKILGLILISTNYRSPFKYKHIGPLAYIYWAFLQITALLFWWQGGNASKHLYYQHGKAAGYWSSTLDGFRTMPLSVNFWMLSRMVLLNLKAQAQKIRAKTLIINSLNDLFISKRETEELHALIPSSRAIFLTHESHFLATNYQHEVLEHMMQFVDEIISA